MSSTKEILEMKKPFGAKDLTPEKVVAAYRCMACQPSLVSATMAKCVSGDGAFHSVRTVWSERDVDRKETTHFTRTFTLQSIGSGDSGRVYKQVGTSQPQEVNKVLWDVSAPSDTKRAVVVKQKDKKGEDKLFIEIWNLRHKVKTVDMKALDKHGDIVGSDGQFGNVQWSPCEKYLLYIAEKKKPNTISFFDNKPDKGDNADQPPLRGQEYLYRESWGEQLTERHSTVVCRLCINTGTVTLMTAVPEDICPGQAVWGPDSTVVFIGWCQEPFRLGLKFCVERRSFLYKCSFDGGECEKLSEEGRAVRCPSFNNDLSRLVYLDMPEGGAHNQCSRLLMIDWKQPVKQGSSKVILEMVNRPDPGQEGFPGVYTWADQGTGKNWLEDGVHMLVTSFWRTLSAVLLINTDTGTISRLCPGDFSWSCSLLEVRGCDVLLNCSLPDRPHTLMIGHIVPEKVKATQWTQLGEVPVEGHKDEAGQWEGQKLYEWRLLELDPRDLQAHHPHYDYLTFEALLYLPVRDTKDSKHPLVLFPHGGPHSAFDRTFQLNPAVFACCGYAVLCVNFRGSLGFGQDSVQSLLGHIGDFDVKDCKLALDKVLEQNLVDPENVFVYGGSHGGFLSAHLIGQYPTQFKAASMRNPVINLTSMVGTSDIPDWVFTEAGDKFDYKSQASDTLLAKLWNVSPIRYIDNVRTPVMLNTGLKDLRVPPSQSVEYYKALKARGVPVRFLTYPDSNHSLSEVDVEADSLINSILWFTEHISQQG